MHNRCVLCGRSDDSISLAAYTDWVNLSCSYGIYIIIVLFSGPVYINRTLTDLYSFQYQCPECNHRFNDFV